AATGSCQGPGRCSSRRAEAGVVSLPAVLTGPLLRRAEPGRVLVWLATSRPVTGQGEIPSLASGGGGEGPRGGRRGVGGWRGGAGAARPGRGAAGPAGTATVRPPGQHSARPGRRRLPEQRAARLRPPGQRRCRERPAAPPW